MCSGLPAQPSHQSAQSEEVDGVGMVVARQHIIDARRFLTSQRAEQRQAHALAEKNGGTVGDALEIERLHRSPCPRQGAFHRCEMAPDQVDDAHTDRGANIIEQLGRLTRRRRFGDGGKRIGHLGFSAP